MSALPELRFKGFDSAWTQSKVIEFAETKTGSRDTQNRVQGGLYPFYVRSDTIERINSFDFDGEAVLTSGDGVGVGKNIHYINGKFDYHQRVYAIRNFTKDVNGKFFFHFFKEKFYQRVMRLSAKNSVDSVRMSMITDMIVPHPCLIEQKKIAAFLSTVDEKLAAIEAQLAGWRDFKRGMIQKLFSQTLRFKADDGSVFPEWENARLDKVAKVSDGTHQTPTYVPEGIPFYSVEHVTANQFEETKFIEKEVFEKEKKSRVPKRDDVIMTRIGDIGTAKHIDWDVCASIYVSLALLKPQEVVLGRYLADAIMAEGTQRDIYARSIHVAFPKKINLGDLTEVEVPLPSLPEQKKIAEYLSALDAKIDALTNRLDAAREFKRGLLQKMFV